ncbi:MAG TPA: hypothetical protein VIO39_03380, partial [Methylotenera sp.]
MNNKLEREFHQPLQRKNSIKSKSIVNTYYTHTRFKGDNNVGTGALGLAQGDADNSANITTGLLPNYLSV